MKKWISEKICVFEFLNMIWHTYTEKNIELFSISGKNHLNEISLHDDKTNSETSIEEMALTQKRVFQIIGSKWNTLWSDIQNISFTIVLSDYNWHTI